MTKAVPETLSPAAKTPGRVAAMVFGLMAMVRWRVMPTPASSGMKARPARCPTEKMTVSAARTCSDPGSVSTFRRPSASKEKSVTRTHSTPAAWPWPSSTIAQEGAAGMQTHAFRFGRLGLPRVARHAVARFDAGQIDLGAQPHGAAGDVDRHVAAAQHEDAWPEGLALGGADLAVRRAGTGRGGRRAGSAC